MTVPEAPKKDPWYFSTGALAVAFLVAGPLALPFLWLNPRHSVARKIFWTAMLLLLTYLLILAAAHSLQKLNLTFEEIKRAQNTF